MSKKRTLYSLLALVIALSLTVVYLVFIDRKDQQTDVAGVQSVETTNITNGGVTLTFESPFKEQELSSADISTGFLHRLESTSPPILFTVRQETGLQIAASATGQDLLDMLTSNVRRAYPGRFPGFEVVTEKNIFIDGRDAKDIVFTYNNSSGQLIKQRFVIVRKTADIALYISIQSQASSYEEHNTRYFDRLLAAIKVEG